MRRTDPQGSGYAPDVGGPGYPVEELWTWDGETNVSVEPVVADGTVYVNDEGHVTALDAETGERLWQSPPGAPSVYGATLALGDDQLFVGSPAVRAIDPETGEDRWRREMRGYWPVVAGDRLYVRDDAVVSCLDAATGETRWQVSQAKHVLEHQVDEEGRVFTRDRENVVSAYDPGGNSLWSYDLDVGRQRNEITCGDGRVFVTNGPKSRTVALDAKTGERLWSASAECNDAPAYDGEYVYVAGFLGTLSKFDAETGEVPSEWTERDVGYSQASPVVTDDALYHWVYESTDGDAPYSLAAHDPETGQEQWRSDFEVSGGLPTTMALTEDVVYYATANAIRAVAPQ